MKALLINKPFEMTVEERPVPIPGEDEVLIEVKASGICAGDLYHYVGKNPYAPYPQICGHEISGIIVDANNTGVPLHAPVVVEPFVSCGSCYPCRVGKPNCCTKLSIIGVHVPGGYAEYVAVPKTHVHLFPDTVSITQGALAEPITIAIHACQRAQVQVAERVFVMGCGPIGIFCIEVAREMGADVYACDVNPDRLAIAEKLGAKTIMSDDQLIDKITEITSGEGFPVVIEATGSPAAIGQTADIVAAGGRIVIAGLVKKGVPVSFPGLDFTRKELTILGTRTEVGCFPLAVQLLAEKKIKFAEMCTELDMWNAPEVFATLSEHPDKIHKGLLLAH